MLALREEIRVYPAASRVVETIDLAFFQIKCQRAIDLAARTARMGQLLPNEEPQ